MGRLAGGVAHDFNNLLTTIGVYAELLLSALPEESPLKSEVGQIRHAQRQAAALTQQLLTLGRRHYVELDVLELNEVLSDMASLLRHVMSPAHELELDLGEGEHPIRGNLDQIQQIVLNLVINARDAMGKSGRLVISTARCGREELERKDLGPDPDRAEYVRLAVEDTGCGMSAEARDRAFDPFFTTKSPDGSASCSWRTRTGCGARSAGSSRPRATRSRRPGAASRRSRSWSGRDRTSTSWSRTSSCPG